MKHEAQRNNRNVCTLFQKDFRTYNMKLLLRLVNVISTSRVRLKGVPKNHYLRQKTIGISCELIISTSQVI